MACRLCLQLGIDDPEQWLEMQPERVVALWTAFDNQRPIGRDWEQFAQVMGMIESVVAASINPHVEEKNRIVTRDWQEFLPMALRPEKKRVSLKQQLQIVAKVFGGKDGDNNK